MSEGRSTTDPSIPIEVFVTHKQLLAWVLGLGGGVVVALGAFAIVLWTGNASAQREMRAETREAVAKVEATKKEIDAGVANQVAELRSEVKAWKAQTDATMRCVIDRRFCSEARELLAKDPPP